MGMEELIATLERETDERCTAAREEARREAERIGRETDERLERRRADAARTLDAELRASKEAGLAETRREVRGGVLRARRRAVDRVFRRAAELLPMALDDTAYLEALPGELRGALSCIDDVEVEMDCPPGLAPHLETAAEAVRADASAGVQEIRITPSDDAPAGFVVRGAASGVRVDATLRTRLEVLRPELEPDVLRELEGPEGADR
ncbi:MAG: V-type ATP synthase subunit E family protein [Gemmatimonadota bacterium]